MAKVRVLPSEIVSKIAAGEVIERPASVVKELLENSLDANASTIEMAVRNSGKTLIQIRDDGSGIDEADMNSVFTRHATSKISSVEDLDAIASLGFRGEALYSIAAVADITMASRTPGEDTGWELHVRAGERLSYKPVTMRTGTAIDVQELFFNTPARKKFLKSDTAEFNRILDLVIPYTLLYPRVRFTVTHDARTILDLKPAAGLTDRISASLHVAPGDLIEGKKDFRDTGLSLELVLGDINIQRTRKDMQFIFINGRPVENRSIGFHLNEIYRALLAPGVHPLFCVFVSMPAHLLDVNVHPTKREVRIKDENVLIAALRHFSEQLLMTRSKAKQAKTLFGGAHGPAAGQASVPAGAEEVALRENDPRPQQLHLALAESIALYKADIEQDQRNDLKAKLRQARYLGNLLRTFLLFETSDSLLIIDQHAAQERISFEKLRSQIEASAIEVQKLLAPVLMKLNTQELLLWEEIKGVLEKIGFETSLFDKETLAIHSHPQLITEPQSSVRNLLAGEEIARMDPEKLARLACRSSVMAGFAMNKEQAEYQRAALLEAADPFTCPHGRPTVVEIPESALRKQFLR